MRINKHNLTIAEHCAPKELNGYLTNGLQFTKTGTMAINRCYSVAVSALKVDEGEARGCIFPVAANGLAAQAGDGELSVDVNKLPLMKGTVPIIVLPQSPVQFEMTLSANFLLKLSQSVCNFTGPEDAVVRIQFTGAAEPVRLDARNSKTGQKWEALVMPRALGSDTERFADELERAKDRQKPFLADGVTPNRQAFTVPPPPPPVADELAQALAAAQKLAGM